MVIKNKDGSVYKLTSPNPIRKAQKQWSDTPMVFHNFDWKGLTLPDETAPSKSFTSDIKQLNVSPAELPTAVMEPPAKVEVELPNIEEDKEIVNLVENIDSVAVEEPVEVKIPTYNAETDKFLSEQKLVMWCSPPLITEQVDHLYGEKQRSISYTTKFSFEGIIISQSDLEMVFWAPVNLTRNSIIYPREVKTRRSRWWRIVEVKQKDGTIAKCIPSDHSLNFSD